MREYHILNLGAGVQSTAMYLLNRDGELCPRLRREAELELHGAPESVVADWVLDRQGGIPDLFDFAIFGDTQEEDARTYKHLEWLESLDGGAPIVRVTAGKLGDDLIKGRNTTGGRFAAIPAFTAYGDGETVGRTRRQCTKEYKVDPIDLYLRREVLKLPVNKHIPKDVTFFHYFGFSTDEPGRAARTRNRFKQIRYGECRFPLMWEEIFMSRGDCQNYLAEKVPHEVVGSVCVFCPFKTNRMWRDTKQRPDEWKRAIFIDEALRTTGSIANRDYRENLYLHRSARPLAQANLDEGQMELFGDLEEECEGGCGL